MTDTHGDSDRLSIPHPSRKTIYAALIGNLLIAMSKFIASAFTNSSAMVSEGVHSLVDTSNEVLLLHGLNRSTKPPDDSHPLGYGRELYFWSFVVALLVFALGAGISFYEGITHILNPASIENAGANLVVLALSAVFEGYSWRVAFKKLRSSKGRSNYLQAIRQSKDPTTFTVLLEDCAALTGIGIAFVSITLSQRLDMPMLDGLGSICIAILLALTAYFLAQECKGLLIGERAAPAVEAAISKMAKEDPAIQQVNGVITVHMAPDQVVAALSAHFHDEANADDIEECVERLETRLASERQEVTTLFGKPQTGRRWSGSGPSVPTSP
ncbi:cation diffusion facilitator family transporter [Mesorhizobium sp. MSK_1335]|uniref:Cation diffusion facilitator family transporter n=1 Tax=Mesorhizobium montanum TaxID=3072323 RepID=A0ABU4ZU57_9HYPH|nr:cation diffusion facilitator family transporter [Mesorhizobium sp. MSK_1335]MDX8528948.1 cation diffusion facilitator family transporter [Mesorhizobium sp. MSK_1335]